MGIFKKLLGSSREKEIEKHENPIINGVIDFSKIYPRIKALLNDDNNDENVIKLNFEDSPIFKPFAEELVIFYMIDKDESYEFLQNKHLSQVVTIDKIHNASMSNLANAISDKTEVTGSPDEIMMVTNGGNFEATMLLADFLWDELEPMFGDKICVSIPANDLLFISSVHNVNGREKLRKTVKLYFDERETRGLVSRNIYARNNQAWELIEKVE